MAEGTQGLRGEGKNLQLTSHRNRVQNLGKNFYPKGMEAEKRGRVYSVKATYIVGVGAWKAKPA